MKILILNFKIDKLFDLGTFSVCLCVYFLSFFVYVIINEISIILIIESINKAKRRQKKKKYK